MYPKEISTDVVVGKMQEELAVLRGDLFQAGRKVMELSAELEATKGDRDRLRLDVKSLTRQLAIAEESSVTKAADLEAVGREKEILQGFLNDARENIQVLTEEKAQEAASRRHAEQEADEWKAEAQELRRRLEASEARERALKNRNLWQRIFRKGEE